MLGYDPERVEVLLYQLVHLTRGGEQAKMSKRRGDVVFLDDFMDEVGVDAARWYLVNRGPDQTIEIDVDLAAEQLGEEPGLLRPVRARADRRRSCATPATPRSRRTSRPQLARRGARPRSSGSPTSRLSRPRRPSGAARTRFRPTRSASRTTSTASTTSSGCSRASAQAFRLGLVHGDADRDRALAST